MDHRTLFSQEHRSGQKFTPWILNCADAAVGTIADCDRALDAFSTLGQGDPASVFRSLGHDIERKTGCRHAAERAMLTLAFCSRIIPIGMRGYEDQGVASDNPTTLEDLICFFADRMRYNTHVFLSDQSELKSLFC